MDDRRLILLRDETIGHETVRQLSSIITYEVGSLVHCLVYAEVHPLTSVYIAEAKIALADIITQTRVLSAALGADYEELRDIGEERFVERMDNVREWTNEKREAKQGG